MNSSNAAPSVRPGAPAWGLVPTLALALVCTLLAPAAAQPGRSDQARAKAADKRSGKDKKSQQPPKVIDFDGLDLAGKMRSPQLLYFLERANEELERASLEKRSFIPHLVRSLEEEAL